MRTSGLKRILHAVQNRRAKQPAYDLCLFGPYGAGNIGDDAVLQALIEKHFDPQSQRLTIVTENPQETARHIRSAYLVARQQMEALKDTIRKSKGVLIAGGTMISDCQGMGFPFGYSRETLETVRSGAVPHAMMGVGVNSVTTPEGINFFKKWYDRVAVFTVRDDHCGNALLDLGIPQDRIVIAADPVFGWSPPMELTKGMKRLLRKISRHPVAIAVNVTHEEWRTRKDLYSEVARCCDRLVSRLGAAVVFFASDCRPGGQYDSAAIDATMKQMSEPAALLPALNYTPVELFSFLSHFDMVVSMRMHPLLLGALGGAIPVGIVRQPKMNRVLEEMGCGSGVKADSVTADELVDICSTHFKELPALREGLRQQLELLAAREQNNRRAVEAV